MSGWPGAVRARALSPSLVPGGCLVAATMTWWVKSHRLIVCSGHTLGLFRTAFTSRRPGCWLHQGAARKIVCRLSEHHVRPVSTCTAHTYRHKVSQAQAHIQNTVWRRQSTEQAWRERESALCARGEDSMDTTWCVGRGEKATGDGITPPSRRLVCPTTIASLGHTGWRVPLCLFR